MTDTSDIPNWDDGRNSAPERPRLQTGLIHEQRIERPKRVMIAFTLSLLAMLCFLGMILTAVLHLDGIRESFITVLNDNLEEDYAQEDKEKAVYMMLGIMGVVAFMIALGLLLASNSVNSSKNAAGRVIMFVLLVLFIPATWLVAGLRADNWLELLLAGLAFALFLTSAILYQGNDVTTWIRQSDKDPAKPLTAFTDEQGNRIVDVTREEVEANAAREESHSALPALSELKLAEDDSDNAPNRPKLP